MVMQQRDPRLDAIDQMARQGQVQRPGMKTARDLQAFEQQHGMPSEGDRLANPRQNLMQGMDDGRGSPNDQQGAADAAQMSDEDLLAQVQQQMEPPAPGGKGPFTGNYDQDLIILNKALQNPGVDANALEEIFNQMYPDDGGNDQPTDEPTSQRNVHSGRY